MIGAGVYVMYGSVVGMAGPGIVLSFLIAGFVSMLSALSYAEMGTRIPMAGSAYVYTYVSMGELWAFVIGWNIILEHMLGAASVARAWSGYVDSMVGGYFSNLTMSLTGEMHEQLLAKYPDFLAFFVCLSYAAALVAGVKATALINNVLTVCNLAVLILVIVMGFSFANIDNWNVDDKGFLPFGVSGVISAAATCFYAFVGFDSIATSGEEARNPAVSIPLATILSLCVVTILYVLVSAALTLLAPYNIIHPEAAIPEAFASMDLVWAKYAISIGALCGMTSTLLGSLFALPRCLYAMASDGLLFPCFAKVSTKTQVPIFNLAVSGLASALLALFFDLEKLVEFMSIGTLLAYTIVSASVIVLRYRPNGVDETISTTNADTPGTEDDETTSHSSVEAITPSGDMIELSKAGRLKTQFRWLEPLVGRCEPGVACSSATLLFVVLSITLCFQLEISSADLYAGTWWALTLYGFQLFCLVGCVVIMAGHHQNTRGLSFKVPLLPYIPVLSIFCNVNLMVHLSIHTWVRFFIWLAIGLLVYFLYGIHNSNEGL